MWNQRWINGGHFANLRCHSGTLQGSLGSQYHVQICTAYFDYEYKIYQYHPIPIHLYHCNSSRVTPFDSADSAGHGLRGPWPQRPILRRMGVSVWTPNDPSLHLHFWRKSGSEIIVDHFLETKTICEQFLCMIATVRVTWSASTLPGPNMPVLNLALYDSRFFLANGSKRAAFVLLVIFSLHKIIAEISTQSVVFDGYQLTQGKGTVPAGHVRWGLRGDSDEYDHTWDFHTPMLISTNSHLLRGYSK